ncbi:MAG: hypothetical protein EOP47_26260 [Sphingobacteriaceae bacterium]|nr:MAG: hypothetical protein EOP47_26260 [Sphingobacteriaceae bacterium]
MKLSSGLQQLLSKCTPDSYTVSKKYLSYYRILFCLAFIFFVGLPSYSWIGDITQYLYRPPGYSLALFSNGFPSYLFLKFVTGINMLFFILMFFGVWCKWSSILFSVTTIIGHTFWYSFGQVDHYLLWMITPAFLGMAGWGQYFSLIKNPEAEITNSEKDNSIYIQLLALCIGFSMFTSGLQKIAGDWWMWDYEGTHYNFLSKAFEFDTRGPLADLALAFIDSKLIWKAMDYITLVMEVGFLLSVWRRKMFSYFIAAAFVFHVMVVLLFNIRFFSNIIVYAIFIDWASVDSKLGLSKLLTKNALYSKVKIVLYSVSSIVFVYWAWCFFQPSNPLRSNSIVQVLFKNFTAIENTYEASLNLLFIVATLAMLYLTWLYTKPLISNNKKAGY